MGLNIAHRSADAGTHLPEPEDVFLAWLLGQQPGGQLLAAAEDEIRALRRYEGPHPGPRQLIALFEEFRETLRGPQERPQ